MLNGEQELANGFMALLLHCEPFDKKAQIPYLNPQDKLNVWERVLERDFLRCPECQDAVCAVPPALNALPCLAH